MNRKKAKEQLIIGVFESHQNGFGFVRVPGNDETEPYDVYIAERNTNGAFHKDTVGIKLIQGKFPDKKEGKIIKILEHEVKTVVGLYRKNKSFGFVIPDDVKTARDIFVKFENSKNAENNQKVIVRITTFGDMKHNPEGQIIKILGDKNDPAVDTLSIAAKYDIPQRFNFNVREELKEIPQEVREEERAQRKDLRDLYTVTIDSESARDLDDAISLTFDGEHYHLGVHIADVTHYVREGSALDREALRRGTSVYFPDRVIPMLPEELSNGICSLNAGVDRLAMSCIMTIDQEGNITGHELCESVIHVDKRLSYHGVMADLSRGAAMEGKSADAESAKEDESAKFEKTVLGKYKGTDISDEEFPQLLAFERLMLELSLKLREKRYKRGAIDFDFPESEIILNERGRVADIRPYERSEATRLIEDFMLAANETIAEDAFWQELPFLYRVHDKPDEGRMKRFAVFLNNFGYTIHFSNGEIYPMELSKLLTKIAGTEEEALLSRLMLRSLKKAAYRSEPGMHFGLAANYYTHFTSPIRRYPDLQIHRILKENLKNGMTPQRRLHYDTILPEVALQTSETERRADDCEREADKLKKTQYMRRFLGEQFTGIISGMTKYGMYIELPNTVEGMVHVSTLTDDYYTFIEEEYIFAGQMTGRTYRLGQKVDVIVTGTDEDTRTIDFRMANHERD